MSNNPAVGRTNRNQEGCRDCGHLHIMLLVSFLPGVLACLTNSARRTRRKATRVPSSTGVSDGPRIATVSYHRKFSLTLQYHAFYATPTIRLKSPTSYINIHHRNAAPDTYSHGICHRFSQFLPVLLSRLATHHDSHKRTTQTGKPRVGD